MEFENNKDEWEDGTQAEDEEEDEGATLGSGDSDDDEDEEDVADSAEEVRHIHQEKWLKCSCSF